MFLRVSPEDFIIYANSALAAYIGMPKGGIMGAPLEEFRKRLRGEMLDCFQRPEHGRTANRLVTDEEGRVFELKTYSENGVLDIVLNEVTHAEVAFGDLLRSTGTSIENLTEEEIRALRQADRRFATVSVAQMQGLSAIAGRLPPHETQLMLDAFAEEMSECILSTGSTVAQMTGDSITGIFGSPRYHRDHALRAVTSACLQIDRIAQLHDAFSKQGRELPPCSVAIATGEMLIAVIETGARRACHAFGETAEYANRLIRFARPGEVLLTEATLKEILASLPSDWEYVRADTEAEADLSGLHLDGREIEALPPSLRKVAYLIGPGVKEDATRTELYFNYLYAIPDQSTGHVISILRVTRPRQTGSSIKLDPSNVVTTTPAVFLGKYRLNEVIGEGGMGKVWRAQDRFGNTAAIKVLNTSDAATTAQLQRFKREAEIMARLPHRNICRVYEFNEFEGINYIAMEYVEGLTLSDLLYNGEYSEHGVEFPREKISLPDLIRSLRDTSDSSKSQPSNTSDSSSKLPKTSRILPIEQTLAIIGKICAAVQFAHEHDVLHRDLKPGNILLREDGEPLVADFGLAKIDSAGSGSASLSVSGHVVGTVENMAPEQAMSSKTVDGRADVFSIGTILYQLLTGHKFFTATGNLVADAQALQTYTPPRPRALNRHIDSDLEIITMKALRPDREDRYRTVSALQSDLERFARGELISAKPMHVGELIKKLILRHKAVSIVTAASMLIFSIGLGAAAWTINDRRLAAESAQRIAEKERKEAEIRRIEAETARKLAEEQKAASDRALAELELARKAEQKALGLHQKAVAEAHQYSQEKDQAEAERERFAHLAETQAVELKKTQQSLEKMKFQDGASKDTRKQSIGTRQTMDALLADYQSAFSSENLDQYKTAGAIIDKVNSFMERLSLIIEATPDFVPALLLKIRLHLGILEMEAAQFTLQRAREITQLDPSSPWSEDIASLSTLVTGLGSALPPNPSKISAALHKSENPLDRTSANLLEALIGQSIDHRLPTATSNSFGRKPTPAEIATNLHIVNPTGGAVKVTQDTSGNLTIEIPNAPNILDISPLRGLEVHTLRIHGATQLDWNILQNLPIVVLDLGDCNIQDFGDIASTHGLLRVRSLRIANTKIQDLREVLQLPMVEELDISGTPIRNLLPLSGRRLTYLNLANCAAGPLSVLEWMPLQSLVLSPTLHADLKSNPRLRANRTLRLIRTPEDPEEQTAIDFWRRLDAGEYDESPTIPDL